MDSIRKWSDDEGGNRKDQIVPVSDKLIIIIASVNVIIVTAFLVSSSRKS
jgi:hypothetical protein